MPPEPVPFTERDAVRLLHILEAAQIAHAFVSTRARGNLSMEHLDTLGLVKCLEVIGEAAGRLSDSARAAFPDVPWPKVVGMRHRLVHEYFNIDLDQVWLAATLSLPPLIKAIEKQHARLIEVIESQP